AALNPIPRSHCVNPVFGPFYFETVIAVILLLLPKKESGILQPIGHHFNQVIFRKSTAHKAGIM
uniref:hypothetical protein n=1 Tax=Enterocloster clostridioformis TaxID=1531 RepID=UPI0026708F73